MSIFVRGPAMSDRRYRSMSLVLGVCSVLIALAGVLTATGGPAAVTGGLAVAAPVPSAQMIVSAGAARIALTIPAVTGPHPTGATGSVTPPGVAAAVPPALGPINPTTPVTVSVANGQLRAVHVVEAKSKQPVEGRLEPDGSAWRSTVALDFGSTYQLTATAVGEDQREVRGGATVATITPAKLAAASFIPAPNAGVVGVGQPMVVKFSQPVTDKAAAERALKVTTTPEQSGSWYWFSATEAHYRSANYWTPGTTITLSANLFGVDLGGKVFGQANRSMSVKIRDSWVARADGASKQMQIFHNGSLVKTMPVSLGSPKNPSHNGPHVVTTREPWRIMDSCTYGVCEGDPGYYRQKVDLAVRISSSGEFVHSAPWSVRQQGRVNVSHGCVNLSPANAQWFFNTFGIGDVVEITNSGGPTLPVWDTYGDWTLSWSQWQVGSALD